LSTKKINVVETLIQIWEKVFPGTSIQSDSNFFDLGGDQDRANDLFREIQTATGRQLAPLSIYQAPTPALLSELIQDPHIRPFPRYVVLKSGSALPPVFIMHGLGSNILEFCNLVRHLDFPQSLIAFQSRGMDGLDSPCESVEQIAQFYLESLNVLWPDGPYIFVGYSFGGLVALEMARTLRSAGREMALLVMIESFARNRYAPLDQRVRVYSRKALYHARQRLGLQPKDDWVQFTPALQAVEDGARKAQRGYRPHHYAGSIRFVKAEKPLEFPDDPARVWSRFVDNVTVESIPGDHHEILIKNYRNLASVISRYIRQLEHEGPKGSGTR
jgi:thioesterase domain-containing protein